MPIYFVPKVLRGAEQRYLIIEKIAYTIVISVARLRPYFQAHTIIVRTDLPLRKVLQKARPSDRLVEWAIRLAIEVFCKASRKGWIKLKAYVLGFSD